MVTGEANFRVREDVRITGLKVLSTSNSGGEAYPSEYYKDGTKVMVTLPNLNSTITYQVEVTNNTKVDYYLKSKTDATNSNNSMQYTLSGAINEQSPIKASTKSTFNIVISYKSGIALPSNKNLTLETRFVFDILDVTPPTVSFSPQGGEYTSFQTVRITASDANYSKMDVEVRDGSNTKIDAKSKTGITTTTYDVALDAYGTYKILVKAYDKRGNTQTNTPLENGYTYQEYVIKNPVVYFADYLKSKANPVSVTSYESGKKQEMYTFNHEKTSKTDALTDYRYIGNDPYNYVSFDGGMMIAGSRIKWRIIGVFSVEDGTGKIEERVKIMDNGYYSDAFDDDYYGYYWADRPTLNSYLNNTYYNSYLTDTSRSMIANAKYYLEGSGPEQSAESWYQRERASGNSNNSWVGKIGLMNPSDYLYTYALGISSACYNNSDSCSGNEPSKGWIFNASDEWTINVAWVSTMNGVAMIRSSGTISVDSTTDTNRYRPVVYLSSDVIWVDGDGSRSNPYQIAIQ